MDDRVKDATVLVLAFLVVIFFIWALNSSIKASNIKKSHQQEASRRMDLELNMVKLSQARESLEKQAISLEKELNVAKETNASLEKTLSQEQIVTEELKEELDKLDKLKITLEEDLKEALVKCSE